MAPQNNPPFEVYPYNKNHLIDLFSKNSSKQAILKKTQLGYLDGYFSHSDIDAKTIVVENNYIDRDFLEDHAGYYARCFQEYERKCSRLHFFNVSFSKDDLVNLLKNSDSDINPKVLNDSYIGFSVLKPIPETVIGRTCLKTYSEEDKKRRFPAVCNYQASLFGIPLEVKSLAFQEQDQVVAACATSALWSLFHSSGDSFNHPVPSPLEITKSATTHSFYHDRFLPNKSGLMVEQMATAIRNVSLEPNFIKLDNAYGNINLNNEVNEFILKATLYSYLKHGISSILIFKLIKNSGGSIGFHAATIVGYGSEQTSPPTYSWLNGMQLANSSIDRIYVHDDQVGPFAKMAFDGDFTNTNGIFSMHTSFGRLHDPAQNSYTDQYRAIPKSLIIPLYHKIRIPFSTILKVISQFDQIFESYQTLRRNIFPYRLIWDIYLIRVSNLKEELYNLDNIDGNYRKEILLENMPRFIWRARGFADQDKAIDLLFDATDIEQGGFFLRSINYNQILAGILKAISSDPNLINLCQATSVLKIFEWFQKNN